MNHFKFWTSTETGLQRLLFQRVADAGFKSKIVECKLFRHDLQIKR